MAKKAPKKSCSTMLLFAALGSFLPPYMLMFGVAELGDHFSYWKCFILDAGFGSPIAWSVYSGIKLAIQNIQDNGI